MHVPIKQRKITERQKFTGLDLLALERRKKHHSQCLTSWRETGHLFQDTLAAGQSWQESLVIFTALLLKIPRITSQLQLPQDFIPKKIFTLLVPLIRRKVGQEHSISYGKVTGNEKENSILCSVCYISLIFSQHCRKGIPWMNSGLIFCFSHIR